MTERIPETLEESVERTIEILKEQNIIAEAYEMEEDEFLAEFHHSLGRHIRNEWGFWMKQGELFWAMKKLGLTHPDDMSGLILTSVWRKMHVKDWQVADEVRKYQEFWHKHELDYE